MPKAQKKKQEKIIQDRTFGLKNKNKSKAVQKFIKGVQQTVKHQGKSLNALQSEEFQKRKLKKKQQQQQALLNALYKDVNKMKGDDSDQDEDPANIVCPYFKQGLCNRGKKCIYSHDLTLNRTEEIDLYVDQRTQLIMNQIGGNQMNNMSEDQLNKIIQEKEKNYQKGTKTDIVCKHFLEAVQKGKYGWNWNCVNGDTCQYKHCLPPGYKLKKDLVKAENKQQIDIEAKIDEQRNNFLNKNTGSPLVTLEVFLKWKEEKIKRKEKQAENKKKEEEKKKGGKYLRTGKQLFNYDPTLFVDDEQAADNYDDREEVVDDQGQGQGQDEEKRQIINQDENQDEDLQKKEEVAEAEDD